MWYTKPQAQLPSGRPNMRDSRDLITAEDLLVIFSEVTLEYQKRVKKEEPGNTSNKIDLEELLEIFKNAAKKIKE
jgi:adenylate kinase